MMGGLGFACEPPKILLQEWPAAGLGLDSSAAPMLSLCETLQAPFGDAGRHPITEKELAMCGKTESS